jgi:hypothetical protein
MSTRTDTLIAPAVVDEAPDLYMGLIAAARAIAAQIVETDAIGLTGSAAYIHRASVDLIRVAPADAGGDDVSGMAVGECLRRLGAVWPEIAAGTMKGEQIFSSEPTLWSRLMTEWPMGDYAKLAARVMIDNHLLDGQAIELGAGVGSCSTLVADQVGDGYVRTDLRPALLKRQRIRGSVSRYDFNQPAPWRDVDTVFAVNALHCAADRHATLGYVRDMLRPGGMLVLGESAPYTDAHGTPWALNGLFGLFTGWWDIGGAVSREGWLSALRSAGFRSVGWTVRRAGTHDLGGLIWAQR